MNALRIAMRSAVRGSAVAGRAFALAAALIPATRMSNIDPVEAQRASYRRRALEDVE